MKVLYLLAVLVAILGFAYSQEEEEPEYVLENAEPARCVIGGGEGEGKAKGFTENHTSQCICVAYVEWMTASIVYMPTTSPMITFPFPSLPPRTHWEPNTSFYFYI